ncbi:MAG: sugar MFS transporter [Oligoflexales bacterium]|nr:sugar MFS transporter [Oligoflexales bacterium]
MLSPGGRLAFYLVAALFFSFGFITCLNDILIPYCKDLFDLNYKQSGLIQFSFFSAYFCFSLPSGYIIKKLGYPLAISVGLLISGIGALGFLPAGFFHSYPMFLSALFVLACGITLLQVAANPYTSLLGPKETAPARLNLVQAFNSLGTAIAPLVGSTLLLNGSSHEGSSWMNIFSQSGEAGFSYFLISCMLFVLMFVFKTLAHSKQSLPSEFDQKVKSSQILEQTQLLLGIVGIFCYVGAEVGIGSFLVNHISSSWTIPTHEAGQYVSLYWGGAMLGRFVGTYFLTRFRPAHCLAFAASAAVTLVGASLVASSHMSPYFLLCVGVFNSIMFPVIFSLSIQDLGEYRSQGSAYLCMAIVGGAIFPLIQGGVSDYFGVHYAFAIPMLGYIYILKFATQASKYSPLKESEHVQMKTSMQVL